MYAVVRVRGNVSVSPDARKTMELLSLRRVNNASVWPENKQTLKMIKSVENYVTFGKISEGVLEELIEKRGNALEGKLDAKKAAKDLTSGKSSKEANLKNCFRLNPPKGGHMRKGIKKPFSIGGALGNRNEKIDDLIKKMM
jgi:large subunit ribosomal protein L30